MLPFYAILHARMRVLRLVALLRRIVQTLCFPSPLPQEARVLGIPRSAIPNLPAPPSESDLKRAQELLASMLASFMSSEL